MERVTDPTCDHMAGIFSGYPMEHLAAICLEPEPHGAWHVAAALAVKHRDREQLAQVLRNIIGGAVMPEERLDVLEAVLRRYSEAELEEIVRAAESDSSTQGRWYETARRIVDERRIAKFTEEMTA